jgi:hypothetical protein
MSDHEQNLTAANVKLLLELNHAKRQNEAAKKMADQLAIIDDDAARDAMADWIALQ